MADITQHTATVNGVEFAYLSAGRDGPLALCLHGFPDTAHTWRMLLGRLSAEGFRAVAPFQRGFAPTAVPADGRYQTGALALDANAFHESLGGDAQAVVIGHDWGAPAAYGAAVHEPDRWHKVIGMAVPPGAAMGAAFLGNLTQVQRSWYMFFFQHPLADLVVAANDMAFLDMLWSQWSPGYAADNDLRAVKDALRDPANMTAALGYYRAALGTGYQDPQLAAIQDSVSSGLPTQPTLYLHGADDGCIGAEVAESARAMVTDNVAIEVIGGAGHFLHLEQPVAVNDRIIEFLQ